MEIWDISLNFIWKTEFPISTVRVIKIRNVLASKKVDKVGFLIFHWGQTSKIGDVPGNQGRLVATY